MKFVEHLIPRWVVPRRGVLLWVLLVPLVLGAAVARADQKPPLLYPFKIKIGEQEATMKNSGDLFAIMEKPVKADDLLKIEKKAEMLIVNACPCLEDGTIENGNKVVAMFARETDSVKLDQTLTKKPLKPGTYLLNVVAHGKTSRVLITIADPEGKIKFPKVKDIIKFLKSGS